MKDGDAMNEEIIKTCPESGQKIVSLVKNDNYGLCIKKMQKDKIKSLVTKKTERNTKKNYRKFSSISSITDYNNNINKYNMGKR